MSLEDIEKEAHGGNGQFYWEEARTERRFDMSKLNSKPVPVLLLDNQTISTSGNLTSIFAQAKAGKSAVVGAIVGALVSEGGERDFLGWSANLNLEGHAVIHFDTEQSRYDHEQIILTALRRAGMTEPPPWLHSYCLTDIPVKERLLAIEAELDRCVKAHGKVLAMLLDGLGDFVLDVNNAEESNNLVAHLHALAIKYDMVFVIVLHENPGADPANTNKMRGHLGSQMERKSESNVRLVKDKDDITTQYTGKSRHASIPQNKGIQFAWHGQKGMHITVEPSNAQNRPTVHDRLFVDEMFSGPLAIGGMTYVRCMERIEELAGIQRRGAEKRFEKYMRCNLIVKGHEGHYKQVTVQPSNAP